MYDWKKSFIIFYCVQFFVCRNVSLCALSAWVGVYCFRSKIGSQSILYSIDILLLKMISIGRRPYTHFIPSIQMKFVLKENYSWIEIFHMIIFCFARRDDGNGNGIERWMIVEIFSSFFFTLGISLFYCSLACRAICVTRLCGTWHTVLVFTNSTFWFLCLPIQ